MLRAKRAVARLVLLQQRATTTVSGAEASTSAVGANLSAHASSPIAHGAWSLPPWAAWARAVRAGPWHRQPARSGTPFQPQCRMNSSTSGGTTDSAGLKTASSRHWVNPQAPGGRSGSTSVHSSSARGAAPRSSPSSPLPSQQSPFEKWLAGLRSVPAVPLALGFAGALPFLALAPPVARQLTGVLPVSVVENCAEFQVGYGVTIVSFLGAVHWGMAMGSSLSGPIAARIAQERYVWSVLPALLAWPLTLMEPQAASMLLCALLPGVYAWDSYSARRGYLPQWYMSLRQPLTLLATFGMLLTASYFWHSEMDRLEQRKQGDMPAMSK